MGDLASINFDALHKEERPDGGDSEFKTPDEQGRQLKGEKTHGIQ